MENIFSYLGKIWAVNKKEKKKEEIAKGVPTSPHDEVWITSWWILMVKERIKERWWWILDNKVKERSWVLKRINVVESLITICLCMWVSNSDLFA